jgi:hypothetical protein
VDVVDDKDGFPAARGAGGVMSEVRGAGGGVVDVEGAREVEAVIEKLVESSHDVLTGCAEKMRWQTAGMIGEATMEEPWDGVGKAAMAGTHKAQEGASGWVRCSRWR